MKEVTASARTAPLVYVELPGTQHISMLTGGGSDRIGLSAAPSDPGCKTPALLPKPTQRSQASLLVADFLSQTLAGRRDVRLGAVAGAKPTAKVLTTGTVSITAASTAPGEVDPKSILYTRSTVELLPPKPAGLVLKREGPVLGD